MHYLKSVCESIAVYSGTCLLVFYRLMLRYADDNSITLAGKGEDYDDLRNSLGGKNHANENTLHPIIH